MNDKRRSLTGAGKANHIDKDTSNVRSIRLQVDAIEVAVPRLCRRIIEVGHAVVSPADEVVLGDLVIWFRKGV
jgi:hypothetical protein